MVQVKVNIFGVLIIIHIYINYKNILYSFFFMWEERKIFHIREVQHNIQCYITKYILKSTL